MRKYISVLAIILAVSASCIKSKDDQDVCQYDACAIKAPASETIEVEQYLADHNITDAVKHCSGMYYRVVTAGAGASPQECSIVTTNYKGMLQDGTVFDQTTTDPASFHLFDVIRGWQNGLPLIKAGGSIQLYIPPSLAYGAKGNNKVPPNAMLVFEVQVIDVK